MSRQDIAPGNLQQVLSGLTSPGGSVPGLSVAIVKEDRILWTGAAGVADIAANRPAIPSTVYLWFSMTKIVTATAVMQLAERSSLELDDPVNDYVPEFPNSEAGPVTIRHLLSHSSRLGNPIPVRWVRPAASSRPYSRQFMDKLLARNKKLKGRPGASARYSNLGYLVLGEVVAVASGTPYISYVKDNILAPLGMTKTDFVYRPEFEAEAATGYHPRWNPMTPIFRLLLPRGVVGPRQGRFVSFNRFIVDGPSYGGLIGSVEDAASFLTLHTSIGKIGDGKVLTPTSVTAMQEITSVGPKLAVGLGWFRYRSADKAEPRFLEHTGGGGAFFNMMRIYPERRLGLVVMGNASSYNRERVAEATVLLDRDRTRPRTICGSAGSTSAQGGARWSPPMPPPKRPTQGERRSNAQDEG